MSRILLLICLLLFHCTEKTPSGSNIPDKGSIEGTISIDVKFFFRIHEFQPNAKEHESIATIAVSLHFCLVQFRNSASQHIALYYYIFKGRAKSCLSLWDFCRLVRCQDKLTILRKCLFSLTKKCTIKIRAYLNNVCQ